MHPPDVQLNTSVCLKQTSVWKTEDTDTLDKGIATQLLLSEPYLKAPGCHVNLAPPIALTVLSGRLPNA